MSLKFLCAAAVMFTATMAQAEGVDIARRATIYSAEGTKIGRVDQVVAGADGAPSAVKLIYRGKFVTIPASTLSSDDKGLKTSLTNDALKKM